MGTANSMQILRMDGGFKVICDHLEDHHAMKFLAIQFGKHNALLNGVMLPLQYQLASCEMKPHVFSPFPCPKVKAGLGSLGSLDAAWF